nr:hypothetical protein [Tanacetum cinerariifolium]
KIQEVPTADPCTDSEPLEHVQNDTGYNVFANELQHFEHSESISNTCLVETDDSNVIPDSPDIHKGREIAKPITPPSKTASEEDINPEQAKRDKDMQKNLALIGKYFKKIYKPTINNLKTSSKTVNVVAARENVGSKVVRQSRIQCFNCREFGNFAKEYRKPKRVKDFAYHKEKMLMCKQAEQGVPLQAEQYDWLADTDEEVDE